MAVKKTSKKDTKEKEWKKLTSEFKKSMSEQDMKDMRMSMSEMRNCMSEQDVNDSNKFMCAMKDGMHGNETGGFAYFLGFLGAAFYYVTTATSFWGAVIGFLKALVWPAVLVYEVLSFIAI